MTKGKKKKKAKKDNESGLFSAKAARRLQEISRNPLVADVVAATLIGAASALKDSKKARQLAAKAGDELEDLANRGARSGNALWQLALDVGRKSLEALAADDGGKPRRKAKSTSKSAASTAAKRKTGAAPKKRKPAGRPSSKRAAT